MTRMITKAEVMRRVGLTYPTIWKLMRAKKFPRGLKVTDISVRWREDDIEDWLNSRPRQTLKGDQEDAG